MTSSTDNYEQYQIARDTINDNQSSYTDIARQQLVISINTDKAIRDVAKDVSELSGSVKELDTRTDKLESKDSRVVAWIGAAGVAFGGSVVALITFLS